MCEGLRPGAGPFDQPVTRSCPRLDRFEGATFHSARWNHDHDLTGRDVAVIGTGTAAIRFVPAIAPTVARLHLFQRTPPWVLPRADRPISRLEQRLSIRRRGPS